MRLPRSTGPLRTSRRCVPVRGVFVSPSTSHRAQRYPAEDTAVMLTPGRTPPTVSMMIDLRGAREVSVWSDSSSPTFTLTVTESPLLRESDHPSVTYCSVRTFPSDRTTVIVNVPFSSMRGTMKLRVAVYRPVKPVICITNPPRV